MKQHQKNQNYIGYDNPELSKHFELAKNSLNGPRAKLQRIRDNIEKLNGIVAPEKLKKRRINRGTQRRYKEYTDDYYTELKRGIYSAYSNFYAVMASKHNRGFHALGSLKERCYEN